MAMIKCKEKEFFIDGYLQSGMEDLKEAIKKNWDGLGLICGFEGDGKTTLATQLCYYMDNTFNLDRCVFTSQQLINAIMIAEEEQAILFDEAHSAFSSKKWRDQVQQQIISMLTRIRKKRLFILVLSPTFFDLSWYLTVHRARFLIRVYARGLERGFFIFYNRDRKYELWVKGQKTKNMNAWKGNFYGRFPNFNPLDLKDYEDKKDAAEKETLEKLMEQGKVKSDSERFKRMVDFRNRGIVLLKELTGWSNLKIAQEINKKGGKITEDDTIQEINRKFPKEIEPTPKKFIDKSTLNEQKNLKGKEIMPIINILDKAKGVIAAPNK